jgi:hypothetical protein
VPVAPIVVNALKEWRLGCPKPLCAGGDGGCPIAAEGHHFGPLIGAIHFQRFLL